MFGFTFYPLGTMKCPHCGYEGRSTSFKHAKEGEQAPESSSRREQPTSEGDMQAKKIEDSKYEKG
jgi:hypothetical protein